MKSKSIRSLLVMTALTTVGHAQTINWGSEAFSTLVDSRGVPISQAGYVFELGAFDSGFTPLGSDMASWLGAWNVFDKANYDESNGYFTGTVEMLDNGRSSYQNSADIDFTDLAAFIWIRKGDVVEDPGTEWLLVRSATPDWKFPEPVIGCCDPNLPLQWSVSDLSSTDMPLYGAQGGTNPNNDTYNTPGPGLISNPVPSGTYLQTATFVPELSSALVIVMLGVLGLTDRRRRWSA